MRISLLLIVGSLLMAGCRVNPRAEREIALLRAEILDLEDQYYSLKSRCEANGFVADEGEYYFDSNFIDGECVDCDSGGIIYEEAPGNLRQNNDELESIDSVIEEPSFDDDSGTMPDSGDSGAVLRFVPHQDEKLPPRKVSFTNGKSGKRLANSKIVSVSINRRISQGEDLDGIPGHEGLNLLIQTKDSLGNVKKVAGHITVSIREPLSNRQERQLGVWQFTPGEAENFFVKDEFAQQGILLHLPWDGFVPQGDRLNVAVKFTLDSQRTFATSAQIGIVPPPSGYDPEDPLIANWIETDRRWVPLEDMDRANMTSEGILRKSDSSATQRRISAPGWRPVR